MKSRTRSEVDDTGTESTAGTHKNQAPMRMALNNLYVRIFSIAILMCVSTVVLSARTRTSLNLGWKFTKSDVQDAEQNRFDDSKWQRINIPHTWNVDDPWDDEPGYYRGAGWYRRELQISKAQLDQRHFLYFEGANQVADVYVNGQKAGSHIGGYSAFAFDVTSLLKPGRNVIAVRVDNSFNEDIPPLTADFNFYGGIYRDVWLISTGELHIDLTDHASPGVRISTPDIASGKGSVSIDGTVVKTRGAWRDVTVVTTITDASHRWINTATARPGDDGKFVQSIEVRQPKLWSPDSPYLYNVKIAVRRGTKIIDEIVQPLGFRWFSFDGEKGFALNGKHLKLRGTNRHQDYAGLGNALPDRLHVRDMQIIKNAGFNFVRLAHYPQDPAVLEACDRLGLLVWEETPLVNYVTKSAAFTENSERMVREMIRQHANHPSVILWGYMNEIFLRVPKGRDDLYPATVELARRLNTLAKQEDLTRPTTIALHGNDVYNKSGLADIPDVIGWNLYQGWYSSTVEDFGKFLDEQHRRFPKRPLIVSEYGANGDLRLSSNDPRRFDSTIEYQRQFHESYWSQIQSRPYLSGSAIWSQFDFGSEYRGETIPHLNQKGMYKSDRTPKDIHFFYKAQLSKSEVIHLAVNDTPVLISTPQSNAQTITVYSNLPEAELFIDGRSVGKKSIDRSRKQTWTIPLSNGLHALLVRGVGASRSIIDSATVRVIEFSAGTSDLAINVGSNANFTGPDGRVWIADQDYSATGWGFVGKSVKRVFSASPDRNVLTTNDDPLFQTMAEGLTEYRVDVPSGTYDIELLFCETKFEKPGERVFDVLVNGKTVLEKLDLASSPGRDRPFRKQITIQTNGGLSIGFLRRAGEPIFNGLRITRKRP